MSDGMISLTVHDHGFHLRIRCAELEGSNLFSHTNLKDRSYTIMPRPLTRYAGNDSLDRATGRQLPSRLERAVAHDVALTQGRAIVQAARTQAVEYVAHSALRAVEGLTDVEALALQRNPLGDARYKAIVDTATTCMARIVAETAQG
jgi:hypothetical protein